jgi:hypothetical protein
LIANSWHTECLAASAEENRVSDFLGEDEILRIRRAEMTEAVLNYLDEHPHAMDSLEGIAEWWIMRHKVRVEVDLLSYVLEQLTEQGLLQKVGSGENARYRLGES